MNWGDLLAALALVMIIEGIVPFISPQGYKNTMQQLTAMPESTLRGIGFGMMLAGAVFLYFVRA
jgi:uncharacterized protein YjeT (DUF2065 family)